jgi:hypothetical protein
MVEVSFPSALWVSNSFPGCTLEILSSDGKEANVSIRHTAENIDNITVPVSYIMKNYHMGS